MSNSINPTEIRRIEKIKKKKEKKEEESGLLKNNRIYGTQISQGTERTELLRGIKPSLKIEMLS